MKIQKCLIGMMALFLSMSALAEDPRITDVTAKQRWPWSRAVEIDFVLTQDLDEPMDIAVEAYNRSDRLDLPSLSLSGDLSVSQRGAYRIVWDSTETDYADQGVLPKFNVTLTLHREALYAIIDLTKSVGETNQIDYVYEDDLTNDVWGTWVRDPVTNRGEVIGSVIWTGVTNNMAYKTDKLVLRRIPKGDFDLQGAYPTTLTQHFYIGVFEVTQRQWELIMGDRPSQFDNPDYYETRPVENISYNDIRGATDSLPPIDWPHTGSTVLRTSFIGKIRAKTGLIDLDLPTSARWEYACRAQTTTSYYNGDPDANAEGDNYSSNQWMDVLGRYSYNGGRIDGVTNPADDCGPEHGTAIVGSYRPNAWGLYDMAGNVYEWSLDWDSGMTGGVDPEGVESGVYRQFWAGSYNSDARRGYSGFSTQNTPSTSGPGFRVVTSVP